MLSVYNMYHNYLQHVILSALIGTRDMQKRSATYNEVYINISNQVTLLDMHEYLLIFVFVLQNSFGGSLNAGGGAFGVFASGEVGFDLKTINDNINSFKQSETSSIKAQVGSEEIPAPFFLKLKPIAEMLSKNAWGSTWDDYGIGARQRNLKAAINKYPEHIHAHIDNGKL